MHRDLNNGMRWNEIQRSLCLIRGESPHDASDRLKCHLGGRVVQQLENNGGVETTLVGALCREGADRAGGSNA